MRILQKIFKENYDIFNSLNPNINIRDNANKMINCGNGDGILYACEDCLTFKYVPFTCKSRFCPSCGKIYSKSRSNTIQNKLIKCYHRHLVFTIDDTIRTYFLNDRKQLNILFFAAKNTIEFMFNRLNVTPLLF